ncbi:MAG: hypothetical protein AAB426_13635 [Myxococcota bacterium]
MPERITAAHVDRHRRQDAAAPAPAWPRAFGPATPVSKTFAARADRLLQSPAFRTLTPAGQAQVRQILADIPTSPRAPYLFDRLEQLIATPALPQAQRTAAQQERLASAVRETRRSAKAPGVGAIERREEDKAASPLRRWTVRRADGKPASVRVDRHDPTDLVVQVQVRLIGDAALVAKVQQLEDGIEKQLGIPGFTADLKLVERSGPDVLDVTVDPRQWPTERNWVGTQGQLAHEIMHAFGLRDEYDVVGEHSTNRAVSRETRLQWFAKFMNNDLPADAARGIMATMSQPPLERHVCQAVGLPVADCVRQRAGVSLRPSAPSARR